ncbi:MAG: hypothetical protein H6641_22380 [Caldilineaceae bacterium]|nr:hypothetical protein [Caldilineaceae bacterium]
MSRAFGVFQHSELLALPAVIISNSLLPDSPAVVTQPGLRAFWIWKMRRMPPHLGQQLCPR